MAWPRNRSCGLPSISSVPFASVRLADAGARDIKIERPEGDLTRGYDSVARGQSSYFVWLNRGNESLVLDLATPDGRTRLAELLSEADVLIQNLKPGALPRMDSTTSASHETIRV